MLRDHIRLGRGFAGWVRADPRFTVIGDPGLATVCFRLRESPGESGAAVDERNRALLARINAEGRYFLTGTMLGGRYTLRLALGHLNTREEDVRGCWELLRELGARELGS
jgi:aromatic-L-amino-acid decarboxylase